MDAQGLWPADGALLLAVSGGPDSTALLLILARLAKRKGLRLAVAHFDHGLRGAETGEAETRHVRELAESLGVPFFAGRGDVRAVARARHLSLEEAARRERYAFLATAVREAGMSYVATGHTASDQAETVVMHLLRGAGLAGLGGMVPRSSWPVASGDGLTLLRPLLPLTHDETLAYCDAAGVTPLEDETNLSLDFARNRVRHALLPAMRAFNPRLDAALLRLADAAREDVAYIEGVAAQAVIAAGKRADLQSGNRARGQEDDGQRDDGVVLPRVLLSGWPASLRRHALRLGLEALAGDGQGFGERHLLALERLVLRGRTGDSLDLPREVRAELTRASLLLRLGAETSASLPAEAVELRVPGEARFGGLTVAASFDTQAPTGATSVLVDAEAIGAKLSVRRRRPGDRFQPLGLQGAKKLQDFFVDAHVPRSERDAVPLFENERGIVWVGGLRIADRARPRDGRPAVLLSYRAAPS